MFLFNYFENVRLRWESVHSIWYMFYFCQLLLIFVPLTNSMDKSPWEANRFSASQENPHVLCNLKAHYHIHKGLPPVPTVSELSVRLQWAVHWWTKNSLKGLFTEKMLNCHYQTLLVPGTQLYIHEQTQVTWLYPSVKNVLQRKYCHHN